MRCRVAVLAVLLAAVPAFAQVAAPKTAPPPNLTFAQIGLPAMAEQIAVVHPEREADAAMNGPRRIRVW